MSMIDDQNENWESSAGGSDSNKRIKKQREDVSRILNKVQKIVKDNAEEDLDKTIDLGLVLSRTSEGLSYLFRDTPTTWKLLFPMEFYRQIYRLNNWAITEESLKNRPGIVGTWTNWMIYIRFPVGTIKWLREMRVQTGGVSNNVKFHQFSTDVGKKVIIDFIRSVIDLMKKCDNWDQFKRLLAKGYGKTFQTNMFDKDELSWKPSR